MTKRGFRNLCSRRTGTIQVLVTTHDITAVCIQSESAFDPIKVKTHFLVKKSYQNKK